MNKILIICLICFLGIGWILSSQALSETRELLTESEYRIAAAVNLNKEYLAEIEGLNIKS